jgi:hypothetical protein
MRKDEVTWKHFITRLLKIHNKIFIMPSCVEIWLFSRLEIKQISDLSPAPEQPTHNCLYKKMDYVKLGQKFVIISEGNYS